MLLNLPDELLVYGIIEVIDDFQDLQSLSLTCRQLYGLTTPYIYRSIRLLTAQGATSLAETVENSVSRTADSSLFVQPTLAEKIQVLDLRPRFNRDVGFERLTSKLKWMTNLRELTLESSRCNYGHYWESADPIDWPKLMYGYPLIFMEAAWGLADQKPLQNLTSRTYLRLFSLICFSGPLGCFFFLGASGAFQISPLRSDTLCLAQKKN